MFDQPLGIIILEILGLTLLALYLARRIILTTIYCCLLIKFSFIALRRRYRIAKVYVNHFEKFNSHGFLIAIPKIFFGLIYKIVPQIFWNVLHWIIWLPARLYCCCEKWFIRKASPWIYARLPHRLQRFCDAVLRRVFKFMSAKRVKRRRRYAALSLQRYYHRLLQQPNYSATCPMRKLLPLPENMHKTA